MQAKSKCDHHQTYLPRHPHRRLDHPPHHPPILQSRNSQLDDLLKPPLKTTLPLPKMPDTSLPIPQNLHLHMPPTLNDSLLDKNPPARTLPPCPLHRRLQVLPKPHEPHAPSSSPVYRFDHDRQTNLFDEPHHAIEVPIPDLLFQRRQNRNATPLRQPPRSQLIPRARQNLLPRPHDEDPRFSQSGSEFGAFAQESIAGVHGIYAVLLGEGDEEGDVCVGRGGGEGDGVCCGVRVGGVGWGVEGVGLEVEFARGAEDAGGDFTSGDWEGG